MNEPLQPAVPPALVLQAFGLEKPECEQITSGHINLTWRLQQTSAKQIPEDLILQRVNRIFAPSVQNDIAAVTAHLRDCSIPTIEMISTSAGDPFLQHEGEVWRLLKYIDGTTIEQIENERQAIEAGRVLGEFHSAMQSFRGALSYARTNVHDFSLHLQRLDMALLEHGDHRHHTEVAALGAVIVETAAEIRDFPPTRNTFVHGDPKVSNVIFNGDDAVCLIDLDTISTLPVEIEIADALRSWCNVASEDSPDSRLSPDLFAAACSGYARLNHEVAEMLPDMTAKIAVELAARFCADALAESYFGWDQKRFESASAHNQARCQGQLALAADILRQRPELRRIALSAVQPM